MHGCLCQFRAKPRVVQGESQSRPRVRLPIPLVMVQPPLGVQDGIPELLTTRE